MRPNKYLAAAAFVLTVLLYSYISFHIFPPSQFVKYSLAAEMYLDHQLPKERLLDYSPLYFSVNLWLRHIFTNPNITLQWIQIFLVGVSSSLLFLLLSHFYRRNVAIAGTIAFILNRTLMAYTTILEPEPFLLLFLIASLFFVYRETTASHLVAGIFFALGILTRPNFLPVLAVVPFHFIFQQRNRRKALISTMAILLPVSIALISVWVRNAAILGYFSPIVMNPGTTVFEGNNPLSHGQGAVYPALVGETALAAANQADYQHQIYRIFARRATNRNLSLLEVNSYWVRRATDYLKDYPGHSVILFCTKLFHCFHNYQWHDLSNAYWNESLLEEIHFPVVPFSLISTLAILGLLVKAREGKRLLPFYAVLFCQLAIMVAIYVHARHRLAILSVFVFFSCAGAEYLLQSRRRVLIIAAMIPIFLCLYIPTDLMREETHLWIGTRAASFFRSKAYELRGKGKWKDAAQSAALAISFAPWQYEQGRPANLPYQKGFVLEALQLSKPPEDFSSRFDQAILLLLAGKLDESEKIFRELINEGHLFKRDQYQSSEPKFYLARIAELRGNREAALQLLNEGIQKSPGEPYLLSHLFVLTKEKAYKEKLIRYFGDIDSQFYLGQAQLRVGNPSEAVENFKYVNEKISGFRRGLFYTSAALARAGRLDEGAAAYRKAISIGPDPVLLEEEILPLFEQILRNHSNDPFAIFSYGVVLRQFGHYNEALQVQTSAQKLDPKNKRIGNEIQSLRQVLQNY